MILSDETTEIIKTIAGGLRKRLEVHSFKHQQTTQ